MAKNEAITFYEPGSDITGEATAAITGKRFVKISANKDGSLVASGVDKGLDSTATGGRVQVAHADAAGRIFGVARYDAAVGQGVGVARASKIVIPVTAGGAIAAFAEVEVGANGTAVTKSAGVAVGYTLTAATNGGDAMVCLY